MTRRAFSPEISPEEYRALRADRERSTHAAIEAAHALGLGSCAVHVAADGSNLVAFVGDELVLKLYPPFLRAQFESERVALRQVEGRLGLATPSIVRDGELESWPFLVMTRVEGVPLGAVWNDVDEAQRVALLEEIGAAIADVQRVPPGPLARLAPRWSEFVAQQIAGCRARHERFGLPAHLLGDVELYLASTTDVLAAEFEPVLLTGEFTPSNVLVERRDDRWRLCGLIDFGDALSGPREYDLLGPATFLAGGVRERLAALLRGYEGPGADVSRLRARRLMRMLLLHRFANFDVQIGIEGWRERARGLDELERLVFPLDGGPAAPAS